MTDEVRRQRGYYEESAAQYDASHASRFDEHIFALEFLLSFLNVVQAQSVIDVGSGTGRALMFLRERRPELLIKGIEPIEQLRAQAYQKGLPQSILDEGTALDMQIADDSFDICTEFGVLHHIRDHERAVREMCRVARRGVLLSDANNWGQGGHSTRWLKVLIRTFGLWRSFELLRTGGKGYHFSEGDGIYYSYSVLSSIRILKEKFRYVHILNSGFSTGNLRFDSPHLIVFAHNRSIENA